MEIWAHSNPVYVLKDGKPVYVKDDREAVREQWAKEAEFYRTAGLVFANERQRTEFFRLVDETSEILRGPQPPWPVTVRALK